MEVHHHAHTSRKKWTHYFWEFIMLFLAVFCGFLAENQREHMIEHQREKKFAASLYEDLKKDTADLRSDIPFWDSIIRNVDTIRMEIAKPFSERKTLLLYKNAAMMRGYDNFEYHDRTIEQLKNGGNFRLIRKSKISDSIIDYDALVKSQLRDQEMQSNAIYQTINFLQDKLFNAGYYGPYGDIDETQIDSVFQINSKIFSTPKDKEAELFQYANHLQYYKLMTTYRLSTIHRLLRRATYLIELIKKEYHLK